MYFMALRIFSEYVGPWLTVVVFITVCNETMRAASIKILMLNIFPSSIPTFLLFILTLLWFTCYCGVLPHLPPLHQCCFCLVSETCGQKNSLQTAHNLLQEEVARTEEHSEVKTALLLLVFLPLLFLLSVFFLFLFLLLFVHFFLFLLLLFLLNAAAVNQTYLIVIINICLSGNQMSARTSK